MKIPFSESELQVSFEKPAPFEGLPATPEYTYPVSQREGVIATYKREPIWQILGSEVSYFAPKVNPDNVARATVMDGSGAMFASDGPDMFGVVWEYVPQVGGCMVRPDKPMLLDANDWERVIKFPDITKWDWEAAKQENKAFLNDGKFHSMWQLNGFFERLISFMEFENAAYALVDEDQQDAVVALMNRLADFYIELFDLEMQVFPEIDGFFFHDDWGSQRAPFFSPQAAQLIVPAMRKVTDFLHSRGKYAELHSCGHLLQQVPNIIAAGWDAWCPQMLNDTHKIYELYGEKLIIGVAPEQSASDITTTAQRSEADEQAAANAYADAFCKRNAPSFFNMYAGMALTPTYRAKLYKASRLAYQA